MDKKMEKKIKEVNH